MFNYGQAAPAASAGDSACAQELLYSFSGSSELAHALQSQPQGKMGFVITSRDI